MEHDEPTTRYVDARGKKKAYYAEGLRRYVARRGLRALCRAIRRLWLCHPRQLLTRYGVGSAASKQSELAAVCWVLADRQPRILRGARSGRTPALQGRHRGR
jgi:hypothetical protein